jgi:putative RecB family exonuclease
MTDTPTGPTERPNRLSPSAISTFMQCQLKYRWSRIDKIPEPPSEPAVLGNMVHECLEELLKLEAGQRTPQAARTIMIEQWHAKWQQIAEQELRQTAYAQHLMRWNAWSCVENYFGLENPNEIKFDGLEEEVFAEVAGVPMLGYMDRWYMDDDGKAVIQDYKTGKVSRPPYDKEKKLQLGIYADLVSTIKGVEVKRGELIYLKGKGSRVSYDFDADRINAVRDTVSTVWSELTTACETGNFTTNKTKLCDWCSYKHMCPAWKRKA